MPKRRPAIRRVGRRRLQLNRGAASQREAVRLLRSNASVALSDLDHPSVIVTSALAGEGKTSTCGQLAWSMAYAGRRVVVLDLDLRHPTAHQVLGGHNEFGVTDVLLDRRSLTDCVQYIDVGRAGDTPRGLYLVATGPGVANPTELLGSRRTQTMIESLSGQADIVLIDSAPVLPVADTLVVGRMVSGALLVVEAHRTPTDVVRQAKNALIRNQTRLFGVVVNKLQASKGGYGASYGYGYGYGADTPTPEDDAQLKGAVETLIVEPSPSSLPEASEAPSEEPSESHVSASVPDPSR